MSEQERIADLERQKQKLIGMNAHLSICFQMAVWGDDWEKPISKERRAELQSKRMEIADKARLRLAVPASS